MKNCWYQCFNCREKYSSKFIEENLIYLCPKCGSTDKNQPLNGVLEIFYNYSSIKEKVDLNVFLQQQPGKFWNYPYLWPIISNENGIHNIENSDLNKLCLNSNNIIDLDIAQSKIKIFDDSKNITLSYKDRASILVAIKAKQLGISEISAASTGNAGSSLAGICARLGIKSHIFVPKNIPDGKRIQIQSFGANIYIVDGDYDEAFDLCLEVSNDKKWYNRNTAFNPLTIEGKKSSVYDMFIELNGKLPNYIFVPVGDGVIISGIYKGLKELLELGWINELPKLIGVQAEGSDAVVRYIESDTFKYSEAATLADSISAGAPRNLYMAAESIKKTQGRAIRVSDDEIITAQQMLAKKGVLAEPAASASLAGFIKLKKSIPENIEDSILMITGNGLKDLSSLEQWNKSFEVKTYQEWCKELL